MSESPEHLGDGAYVRLNLYGNIVFTANHHNESEATDVVIVENAKSLVRWLERAGLITKQGRSDE